MSHLHSLFRIWVCMVWMMMVSGQPILIDRSSLKITQQGRTWIVSRDNANINTESEVVENKANCFSSHRPQTYLELKEFIENGCCSKNDI